MTATSEYFTVPSHLDTATITSIFSRVEVDLVTGCWNWTGQIADGYGRTYINGEQTTAHRLLYAWLVEPVPRGVSKTTPQLDHAVCDNRRCCNPCHMALVLPKINSTRGMLGFAAINAKKTHCNRNHELPQAPDLRYGPARRCLICTKEMHNARRRAQRLAMGKKPRRRPHATPL